MMFKVEIASLTDTTIIVLKNTKPYVQMSYQYAGDFTTLTEEEAIKKVLDSFYNDIYKDKIQEGKITELELSLLKQQMSIDKLSEDISTIKGETPPPTS